MLAPATLDNILADATEALRPQIERAFQIGRETGRAEASAEMKAKLADFLSDDQASPAVAVAVATSNKNKASAASDRRASPGSVRPVIARMIAEADAGVTTEAIVKVTGFKPNSVRGTLWTLGHEGLAVKRGDRWYPATDGDDGISPKGEVVEAVGASTETGLL